MSKKIPIEVSREKIENLTALILIEFTHGVNAANEVVKKAQEAQHEFDIYQEWLREDELLRRLAREKQDKEVEDDAN